MIFVVFLFNFPHYSFHIVLNVCSAKGSFVYREIYNCRFGRKTIRIAGHASREAGREIGTVNDFTRDLQSDFSQRLCLRLCCSRKWCWARVLSKRACKEFKKGLKVNEQNGFSKSGADLRRLSQKEYNELKGKIFV